MTNKKIDLLTLGGTSGHAWIWTLESTRLVTPQNELTIHIGKKPIWIISAIILLFFHVFVLGGSIRFI
jgi:hypothetical protein